MKKRLGIILLVILVTAVVFELVLPRAVSALVARGMTSAAGTDEVTAKVEKRPAVSMLAGQFDQVFIQAVDAKIDKITFAQLDTALRGVELDMAALLGRRAVVIKAVQEVDLSATITQEELARYLNQAVKGIKNAVVTVNAGKVQVSCNYSLGGIASLAVNLDGKIVGDGQKLKFVTERFSLNNTMVGNIGGSVLTEIPLVDLKKLPFGASVRAISMEDGKVSISADNRVKREAAEK